MSTRSPQPSHGPLNYESGIEHIGHDAGLEPTCYSASIEPVNYETGIEPIMHHNGLELYAPVAPQPQPDHHGVLLHPGNHVAELQNQPRFPQAIDAPHQPSLGPCQANQPFEKPATPTPITNTSKLQETIHGLSRRAFGIAAVVALVLVAGAVGGGVAAGLLVKERKNNDASRFEHTF